MKIKNGFKLRPIGDEWMLLGESAEQVNFDKMITLNETAAFLWQQCEKHKGEDVSAEMMADWLCDEYEVTRDIALEDAKLVIADWIEVGIAV